MNPGCLTFSNKDGQSLFGRAWVSPNKPAKGMVFLFHDLGEHSGRYDSLGKIFTKTGYHLASFDLRGHGLSEGPRGHAPSLFHLMADCQLFLAETARYLRADLPKFLYGHGMGGNLVVHYGLQHPEDISGAIVTSPALKSALIQHNSRITWTRILASTLPRLTLRSRLETDALSRNAAIVKAYQNDVYIHDKISAGMGWVLHESGLTALENAARWSIPLLLMHGTADRISSCEASQGFAKKAGHQVDFIPWNGYFHELHNDLGSELVIERMIVWLDQHSQAVIS